MGPLKEELEVELLPKEEDKEDEEDLFIFKAEKMIEEGITLENTKERTECLSFFR